MALSTGEITIERISIRETNCIIHWIEIYPLDSAIHLLNNWALISSFVRCFKKINAPLIFSICFHKTVHNKLNVHNKLCLDKIVGHIGNDLERGFVKHWLNYV